MEPGIIFAEILRTSRTLKADLIVMATRGRSGLVRGLLASVTDRVSLGSSVPMAIVRADNAPRTVEQAEAIETVIVPLDGSELSETALRHAVTMATVFAARVELLTVIPSSLTQ